MSIKVVQKLIKEANAKDTLVVTPEQFQAFVKEAVERMGEDGVDVIADRMQVSKPTVARWINGVSNPHPIMIKFVVREINGLLNQRGIR